MVQSNEKNKEEVEKFREWLSTQRNYSYLTIKNYVAQYNLLLKYSPDFVDMPKKEKVDTARKFVVNATNEKDEMRTSEKKRVIGTSIYNRCYAMKKVLEYFDIDKDTIDENLRGTVKLSNRQHIATISLQDTARLVRELSKHGKKKIALLCVLMYDTGARIRALLSFKRDDFYCGEDTAYIYVREKGGQKVKKYLTKNAEILLKEFLKKNNKKYPFLEKNKAEKELLDKKYLEFWSELKNFSRKLLGGEYGVSAHWFRRGGATELYKEEGIVLAQAFLGHKSIETTKRYLQADTQRLEEKIRSKKRDWGI